MFGAFDSFDYAVIRDRVDDEPATEAFHRLMMSGVHFQS